MNSKIVGVEPGVVDHESGFELPVAHDFAAVQWVDSLDELRSWWDLAARDLEEVPPSQREE